VALRTVVGVVEVVGAESAVSNGAAGSETGIGGAVVVSTMTCGGNCTVVLGAAGVVVTLKGGACSADTGAVGDAATDVDVSAVDDDGGAVLMTTS
jgi:hypothetical protein